MIYSQVYDLYRHYLEFRINYIPTQQNYFLTILQFLLYEVNKQ